MCHLFHTPSTILANTNIKLPFIATKQFDCHNFTQHWAANWYSRYLKTVKAPCLLQLLCMLRCGAVVSWVASEAARKQVLSIANWWNRQDKSQTALSSSTSSQKTCHRWEGKYFLPLSKTPAVMHYYQWQLHDSGLYNIRMLLQDSRVK